MIWGKKDAAVEWTTKWTPAIIAYSRGIHGKAAQTAVQEVTKMYSGMCVPIIYTYTRD